MTTPPGDLFPTLHPGGRITPAHAPGCYYVNLITNSIQRQCNPLNAISLAALGYFGQGGTPADAFNAFPTFEAAQQFADMSSAAKQQILRNAGLPNIAAPGGGTGADDWKDLTIRLAEFAIGAILVTIGLVALVGKTKTAQTVVQVAGVTPPGRAVRAEAEARRIVRERSDTRRIKRRVRSMEGRQNKGSSSSSSAKKSKATP